MQEVRSQFEDCPSLDKGRRQNKENKEGKKTCTVSAQLTISRNGNKATRGVQRLEEERP